MNQLEVLAAKYPWFLQLSSDGVLEMYVDHHILSTMRTCEGKFVEEIANRQHTRTERYWSLEFGAWVHDCVERFYDSFRKTGNPPQVDEWTKEGISLWMDYDLDYYKPDPLKLVKDYRTDEKKYHSFGGAQGAAAFLIHYYAFYMNQRFRVVSTEISFGRGKEVLLGEFRVPYYDTGNSYNEGAEAPSIKGWYRIRCYYTGRIDLLVDNTYKVGPVDHKTTATFDGFESEEFDPHEGITGYIYTINQVLGKKFPDSPHKICRDGWIFHIATNASCNPRFKATLINKTPQQLEDFRLRQVSTCSRIFDVLNNGGRVADWNTMACNNIYNRPCPYRELHRQPEVQREGVLRQFYEVRPAWDPENPPSVRNKLKQKKEEPLCQQP